MNWYKAAERKSLEELLQSLESNPGVDRKTLAWLKTLEDKEKGPAINRLTKNPSASIWEMQSLFPKVVPLTGEQERLVTIYPLIGTWMKGMMERLSGQKRETAFNVLKEKAARIRDWIDRTGKEIQGRTLENAVEETEKWHRESQALERGEYSPSKPEDIVISYQNGYSWQRISSGTDVKIEGQKMNHCVGSFCNDVDEGKIDVYSLRDENNSPLVTAGFKYTGAVVVQMKGYEDADPSETYKGYISDILKKLGTVYNDGEGYLRNNSNLKNFADLNADDIENNTLLQKIVNNQIAREENVPDFARDWAKRILESGEAPKAWEAAINASIISNGDPPNFALDWAKRVLKSGKAPKEWMDKIIARVKIDGHVPYFAIDWTNNKLDSDTAPKELIAGISLFITKNGYVSSSIYSWAKRSLESGTAPQELIEAITGRITANRSPPDFAEDWAKKALESGAAPKEWEEVISISIAKNEGFIFPWARRWAKKALDSGLAPKEWEAGITSHIAKYGRAPDWALDWVKKQ